MRDMTSGNPFDHLWRYALPLLLANWLQLAYNAIDSIIAGRFIGPDALAAEGIAAPIMNLVILSISGICIGAGILMSEHFGAKRMDDLRRTLAVTLLTGLFLSLAVALLGFIFSDLILKLLSCPSDIFEVTVIYLRITFLGAPFTFEYNTLSSALKSVGDSKTPLRFLAFSSILNAVLDMILLGIFHMGITTSAATTVVAQAVSALLAFHYLMKNVPELMPHKEEWKHDAKIFKDLFRYGAPTAMQQAIQPIGKLLIQGQVNALGVSSIAAFHAVSRADDFACIPEQSISSAISTYIAQNRGAKKPERIKKGFFTGIAMEAIYGVFIALTTYLLRHQIVSLFVTKEAAGEVIAYGASYLSIMAFFYILPGMTNGFQGYFRGMGRMSMTILGTTVQISFRALFTYILAPRIGIRGIAFASAIGWLIMLAIEVPIALYNLIHTDKKEAD